jgi:hypothetical protein
LTEQTVWDAFPYQPSLLLKRSYYTAPNELALFPMRLNVSLYAKGVIDDVELQYMVRRDIGDILTRAPALKPALVAAYRSALPEGKVFAERVISEIDPGYLGVVRAGYPRASTIRTWNAPSSTIPDGLNQILGTTAGPNVGLGDTHVLEHTTKIDTSKVAHLNRNQASQ